MIVQPTIGNSNEFNPMKHHAVGGKIFYINPSGDGSVSYIFYDKDGNILSDHTIEGLATAAYYDRNGEPYTDEQFITHDNFYVYNPALIKPADDLVWSYETPFLANDTVYTYNATNVGHGRNASATMIEFNGVDNAFTIYQNVINANNASVGGCTDWYIPSFEESFYLCEYIVQNTNINDYFGFAGNSFPNLGTFECSRSDSYIVHCSCCESGSYLQPYFKIFGINGINIEESSNWMRYGAWNYYETYGYSLFEILIRSF